MANGSLIHFDNLERVLNEYGEMVVTRYREEIIRNGHYAGGALADLDFIISKGNGEISVSLKLQDYWKYLEYRTKPHWAPIGDGDEPGSGLLYWVKVKPVLPDGKLKDKLPQNATLEQIQKSTAYAIQHKIAKVGTPGDPMLHWTLQEVNAYYEEAIGAAIQADLDDAMTAILMEFQTF